MKHKDSILKLRAEGKTYDEISLILECSKGTIAYHCGDGQKEKARKRRTVSRSKQADVLNKYKEDAGCIDCNEKYPYWLLDFDHKPEFQKVDSPYRMIRMINTTAMWEEVAKCDVVCPNCHRIRTYTRNPW